LRILKFAVNGQILKMDPKCDFENIVAGSKNYLVAQFNFNSEWDQYRKVAVFINNKIEYPVLIENNKCVIDSDALTSGWFYVYVIGQLGNERMNTNSVMVRQVLR
jgi:hypothetical protein